MLEEAVARREQQDFVAAPLQLANDGRRTDFVAADDQRRVEVGKDDDTHAAAPRGEPPPRPGAHREPA